MSIPQVVGDDLQKSLFGIKHHFPNLRFPIHLGFRKIMHCTKPLNVGTFR